MSGEECRQAYHEAGHAVAAHAQGLPFRFATIGPVAAVPPHRRYYRLPHWCAYGEHEEGARQLLRPKYAVAALAGPIAEEKIGGARDEDAVAEDLHAVRELLSEVLGTNRSSFPRTRGLAERIIADYWCGVAALADALIDRQRLTAREVRELLDSVLPAEQVEAAQREAKAFARIRDREAMRTRHAAIRERLLEIAVSGQRPATLRELAARALNADPEHVVYAQVEEVRRLAEELGYRFRVVEQD
jgi:hypothetical protein